MKLYQYPANICWNHSLWVTYCNLLDLLHSCEVHPKWFQKEFDTLNFEQSHPNRRLPKHSDGCGSLWLNYIGCSTVGKSYEIKCGELFGTSWETQPKLGNTWTCWKCIQNMWPRHWELDVNNYDGQLHVHWWKDIETIKIKKIFKSPLPSQGKNPELFRCMLHHFIARARLLFLRILVAHLCLDLMPRPWMSLWLTLDEPDPSWWFVWWVISLSTMSKPRKIQWCFLTPKCNGILIDWLAFDLSSPLPLKK